MSFIPLDQYQSYRYRSSLVSFPDFSAGTVVECSSSAGLNSFVLVFPLESDSPALPLAIGAFELARIQSSPRILSFNRVFYDYKSAYSSFLSVSSSAPQFRVSMNSDGLVSAITHAVCSRCATMVRIVGHDTRCDLTRGSELSLGVAVLRRQAWVGDAMVARDVRLVVSSREPDVSRLETTAQTFLSNESLASSYDVLCREGFAPLYPALGSSVRQRATAFEASYLAEFREAYLHLTFGVSASEVERLFSEFVAHRR